MSRALVLGGGIAWVLLFMWVIGRISKEYSIAFDPYQLVRRDEAAIVWYHYLQEIPFGIGYAAVLFGLLFAGHRLTAPFRFAPLRVVGVLGYSWYLWHMPLIRLLATYPSIIAASSTTVRFLELLALSTPAVLLVSLGSYLAVERPFIERGRRRGVTTASRSADDANRSSLELRPEST